MSTVHFVLQGKGGVGKSYAAVLFAQYLRERGLAVSCFDGDPLNQTLGGFAALNVKKVDFLENMDQGHERTRPRINNNVTANRLVCDLFHKIVKPARVYSPTLVAHEALTVLSKMGHEVMVHTIVTGGQALLDTLHGAAQLVKQLEGVRFVVWLNPFLGSCVGRWEGLRADEDVSGHKKAD